MKIALVILIVACCFLSGCAKPEQPVREKPPSPEQPQTAEPAHPQQMAELPPPKLDEVKEAVKRVFKDAAFIHTDRQVSFITGDFNGDLSQDIAVVIKPSFGKSQAMNQEFPAWILKDPFEPIEHGARHLLIEENETLLAVIHGYGSNGWRNPEATQTYLLKNAVGSDMKTLTGKEFITANRGKTLPLIHGDLISEVLQGAPGYLYYTGPTYSWYNPKTFTGEPERKHVHERPQPTKSGGDK